MATKKLDSEYYLKTPGDPALALPAYGSDVWAAPMNRNWDTLDSQVATLKTTSQDNLNRSKTLNSQNYLISHAVNGNFEVWQRYTSKTLTASGSDTYESGDYGPDQWRCHYVTSGNIPTVRRISVDGGVEIVPGASTGATCTLVQRVERYLPLRGKTITLSLDIKTDSTTPQSLGVFLNDGVSASLPQGGFTVTSPEGWVRKTMQGVIGGTATKLAIRLKVTTSTSHSFYMRRLMFAVGDFDSGVPYLQAPRGVELRRCRRYYEQWTPQSNVFKYRLPPGVSGDLFLHTLRMDPKYTTSVQSPSISLTTSFSEMVSVTPTPGVTNPGNELSNTVNVEIDVGTRPLYVLEKAAITSNLWS